MNNTFECIKTKNGMNKKRIIRIKVKRKVPMQQKKHFLYSIE